MAVDCMLVVAGRLLSRRRRALGVTTTLRGGCSVFEVLGGLVHVEAVSMAGLFGCPLWSAALGISLLREPLPHARSTTAASPRCPGSGPPIPLPDGT